MDLLRYLGAQTATDELPLGPAPNGPVTRILCRGPGGRLRRWSEFLNHLWCDNDLYCVIDAMLSSVKRMRQVGESKSVCDESRAINLALCD